ncbi:MAG: glycosyltransferase family 4 protein [Planctomycetota bacterium]
MKILLVAPAPAELFRGSAATARRYRDGLQRRGHLCELVGDASDGELRQSLEGTIARFQPDLVHAHDARTAIPLLGLRRPWVVSVAGEDFFKDVQETSGALVCEVFRRAHRVLAPSKAIADAVQQLLPETVGKVDVVPRAVAPLRTDGTGLRRALGIAENRFVMLLPGGLRPIKGQHRAVSLARVLRMAGIDTELVIVGPDQDTDYADSIREQGRNELCVRCLPALSQDRMGAAYLDADVVLNTSLDEAMSPCILEAGVLGRPVVASNVAGNRELVRHNDTGLLFDDEQGMAKAVVALYRNRAAAGALGVRLREDLNRRFPPEAEVDALLSAYAAA